MFLFLCKLFTHCSSLVPMVSFFFCFYCHRAEYCNLLVKMRKGTATRKAFDRALQALPITQHDSLWPQYIEWAVEFGVPETAVCVYRRYLMFDPAFREDYVEYLETNGHFAEAAQQLVTCIDDDNYVSAKLHTRHEMWMHLCDLCALHPHEVSSVLKVEAILRSGIARFSDEVGRLWCRLADYYIRLGLFDRVRDIYEEAVASVATVRDFTLVFEAYTKFEESVLNTKIRITSELEEKLGLEATERLNEALESQSEVISVDTLMTLAGIPATVDSEEAVGSKSNSKSNSKSKRRDKNKNDEQDQNQRISEQRSAHQVVVSRADLQQYATDKRDVMLRLERLEFLIDTRPLSINAVVLRQNPHNVYEWHKRIRLHKADFFETAAAAGTPADTTDKGLDSSTRGAKLQRVIATYMEAIAAVDPRLAKGKLSTIWLSLAAFYESHFSADKSNKSENLENARAVFRKATKVNFRQVDEQATVWCAWAEMELRAGEYGRALQTMQEAVTEPVGAIQRRKKQAALSGAQRTNKRAYVYADADDNGISDGASGLQGAIPTSERVFKHVKVWELYLDLEENLGTIDSTRAAYDRCMELAVITPQMALAYATFLEENRYFEDSFKVYERSLALFAFPHVKRIWTTYLDKFVERYAGRKLERLRNLYEQALQVAPPADRVEFYVRYSKAEENYGLARHALTVYDRATKDPAITEDELKYGLFRLYIKKSGQFYGITKTRPIYERAIAELGDEHASRLCLEFAAMETSLGEIDRARGIFQHGSQLIDPKHDKELSYWTAWRSFEEEHGNENTFRDMLRMRRSAEVAFSQVNYMAAEMAAATGTTAEPCTGATASGAGTLPVDAMSQLSNQAVNQQQEQLQQQRIQQGGPVGGPRMMFVAASDANRLSVVTDPKAKTQAQAAMPASAGNVEEIDIDEEEEGEDDDKGEEEEDGVRVQQKRVPDAVFGGLLAVAASTPNSDSDHQQPPTKAARLH